MKKMIRKLFHWIFMDEINQMKFETEKINKIADTLKAQSNIYNHVLAGIDVSVDVYEYEKHSSSWAVISLQGQKTDFIKFCDLRNSDIYSISQFLRQYERVHHIKVDASPMATGFLRIPRSKGF